MKLGFLNLSTSGKQIQAIRTHSWNFLKSYIKKLTLGTNLTSKKPISNILLNGSQDSMEKDVRRS